MTPVEGFIVISDPVIEYVIVFPSVLIAVIAPILVWFSSILKVAPDVNIKNLWTVTVSPSKVSFVEKPLFFKSASRSWLLFNALSLINQYETL